MKASRRALLAAAAALLLPGCALRPAAPVPDPGPVQGSEQGSEPAAAGGGLEAPPAEGSVWLLDPAVSLLQVLAFRQGALAALGHNHVLTAPRLQGWLQLPDGGAHPLQLQAAQLAQARFALALRLDELVLDDALQRASLGPAFASVPSAEAIAATRANMLGEAMLDAARHPWLRVHSARLQGEATQLLAEIELDWHGRQRRLLLPLALSMLAAPQGQVLRVQGQLALRLTDFGIRPLSLPGGLLAVQDGVVVRLDLRLVERAGLSLHARP